MCTFDSIDVFHSGERKHLRLDLVMWNACSFVHCNGSTQKEQCQSATEQSTEAPFFCHHRRSVGRCAVHSQTIASHCCCQCNFRFGVVKTTSSTPRVCSMLSVLFYNDFFIVCPMFAYILFESKRIGVNIVCYRMLMDSIGHAYSKLWTSDLDIIWESQFTVLFGFVELWQWA